MKDAAIEVHQRLIVSLRTNDSALASLPTTACLKRTTVTSSLLPPSTHPSPRAQPCCLASRPPRPSLPSHPISAVRLLASSVHRRHPPPSFSPFSCKPGTRPRRSGSSLARFLRRLVAPGKSVPLSLGFLSPTSVPQVPRLPRVSTLPKKEMISSLQKPPVRITRVACVCTRTRAPAIMIGRIRARLIFSFALLPCPFPRRARRARCMPSEKGKVVRRVGCETRCFRECGKGGGACSFIDVQAYSR